MMESGSLRTLTEAEVALVSGGADWVDENGNGFFDEGDTIVVTASRSSSSGGWQIGFGADGFYGQLSVTSLDAFLGAGIGTSGWSFGYTSEADLSGVQVDPTSLTYNIGVIAATGPVISAVEDYVANKVDGLASSISEYIYEPYYRQLNNDQPL